MLLVTLKFSIMLIILFQRLESFVFTNIDGKQIELLELYFTILNKVAPTLRSTRLLPKDHLKLLSKVKATTAGLSRVHYVFYLCFMSCLNV